MNPLMDLNIPSVKSDKLRLSVPLWPAARLVVDERMLARPRRPTDRPSISVAPLSLFLLSLLSIIDVSVSLDRPQEGAHARGAFCSSGGLQQLRPSLLLPPSLFLPSH